MNDIRLITMYLPQYHPIPENDEWWGKGFTEWTNVPKATPRFAGHYQPHVPGRLGYYDLRDSGVRQAQADLAREYGIHGFCYYHYWFNGKRLLEQPFNEVLASGKPNFPFCICWANENWSRRWDGSEHQILMAQNYSDEDSLAFINSLVPAFQDHRYVRVNGKPLLLLYRTGLLPDPGKTTEIWREAMHKAGIGDLYLVRVENFMHGSEPNPEDIGFDAAMEFAPYWGLVGIKLQNLSEIGLSDTPIPEDVDAYDYERCMKGMLALPVPAYKRFRGCFPSWDNTPRRMNARPTIFLNSSPEKFAYWLTQIARQTIDTFTGDERLVFVNAWNEWGEGCHLEPDEKYGLRYLEATRMALRQATDYSRVCELGRELQDLDGSALHDWFDNFEKIYSVGDSLTVRDIQLLKAFENIMLAGSGKGDDEANRRITEILQQKDAVIAKLYESLSWKVTAPLRKVHGKLFGQ